MSSMSVGTKEVAAALAAVSQIDLTPINKKLQHENPSRWTDETLFEAETNYRRFLALNLLHPSESLSVNEMLDDYWHQHILDTRKYAADCEKVFGFFLHHYPYFGIEGEEDWAQNLEAFAKTRRLWNEAFGVALVAKSKLTLDKIVGGYPSEVEGVAGPSVYAYPKGCKNGQHCEKVLVPRSVQ